MSRMASMMPGRESSFSENYSPYIPRFVELFSKKIFH
jgi:hypothetical protein